MHVFLLVQVDIYITTSIIKICIICNNYIYLNQCVLTCPEGTEIDDVNKVCILCSNISKVYYAGDMKCYGPNQCPEFAQLYNNECVNCSDLSPNLYYHSVDKTCYQTCPVLYEANNVLMKCVKCSSYTPPKFYHNDDNLCYETCPYYMKKTLLQTFAQLVIVFLLLSIII